MWLKFQGPEPCFCNLAEAFSSVHGGELSPSCGLQKQGLDLEDPSPTSAAQQSYSLLHMEECWKARLLDFITIVFTAFLVFLGQFGEGTFHRSQEWVPPAGWCKAFLAGRQHIISAGCTCSCRKSGPRHIGAGSGPELPGHGGEERGTLNDHLMTAPGRAEITVIEQNHHVGVSLNCFTKGARFWSQLWLQVEN